MSILIVNWNTRADLERCLAGAGSCVLGDGPASEHGTRNPEIIVVDNASTDGSVEMLRERFPDVTVFAMDENLGYAEGNNLAADAAQGDRLLFLNPDTVVQPGAVEALESFLDGHPRAALAAPALVSPDGSVQASVRGMPTPAALLGAALRLDALFPGNRTLGSYRLRGFDYRRTQEAPQPMASAWMVRKEAWEDVGAFDTAFPLFFNDVDWCLRAHARGWETWYVAEARVEHRGGASTSQVKARATLESHRALAAFYRKHYAKRLGPVRLALSIALIRSVGGIRYAWYKCTRH